MRNVHEILLLLRENFKFLQKKYHVKELKLFGSYVRGEQKKGSDIDIIVIFDETPTFFEFIRLEDELSKILGCRVDLVTEDAISPYIQPYITHVIQV